LVGLTVAQIQAGIINNGLYRLPTNAETQTFFGYSTASNDTTYSTWTANDENEANPATRTFHKSDPANAVLPAAGYRNTSSTVLDRGAGGYYRSSTPGGSTGGHLLRFTSSNVVPNNNYLYGDGMAVRCVAK
jgi:hypothetical protein